MIDGYRGVLAYLITIQFHYGVLDLDLGAFGSHGANLGQRGQRCGRETLGDDRGRTRRESDKTSSRVHRARRGGGSTGCRDREGGATRDGGEGGGGQLEAAARNGGTVPKQMHSDQTRLDESSRGYPNDEEQQSPALFLFPDAVVFRIPRA